jgi:hypothetical protein
VFNSNFGRQSDPRDTQRKWDAERGVEVRVSKAAAWQPSYNNSSLCSSRVQRDELAPGYWRTVRTGMTGDRDDAPVVEYWATPEAAGGFLKLDCVLAVQGAALPPEMRVGASRPAIFEVIPDEDDEVLVGAAILAKLRNPKLFGDEDE